MTTVKVDGYVIIRYGSGMARRPTLTQERLDRLRDDYEAWNPYNPGGPSADEVAARHGVSKNTMYTWRARGWRLDGREGDGDTGWKARGNGMGQDQHNDTADLTEVVRYLTDELVKAKIRIAELEAELARNAQEPPAPTVNGRD